MNIAISRISDKKFKLGQVLTVSNIDNSLVTVKDDSGNSYVIDFEDKDFIFMFNVLKEEINDILSKNIIISSSTINNGHNK